MAKNPIKLMVCLLTNQIYAGRVNLKNNMFIGDREDVTETAINSVIEHLYLSESVYEATIKGVKHRLSLNVVEE